MKKVLLSTITVAILIITGCSRPSTGTSTVGSWTFQGLTYQSTIDNTIAGNTLYAQSNSPGGTLEIFVNHANPITSGTYPVVTNVSSYSGPCVNLQGNGSVNNREYYSTGGNGTETVTLTVASDGKITATGSGIMMRSGSGDSAAVTLHLYERPQ